MEKEMIQHKHLLIRGLNIHIAEIGTGAVVVIFLHGFPEIWYSWRYQMIAVANAGCRAIAPDWRGYGLSEQPPELGTASFMDLVHDLLALLDSLAIPKAFLVAKDFGVLPAQYFALLHPERVTGVITLGVPLIIPSANIVNPFLLPSGFYMRRWQEPGRAEADFGRFNTRTVVRNIYILFSGSQLPVAGEDQEIMDLVDPSTPLPQWFTDEDLTTYTTLYENSKFSYPLQVPYRSKKAESEITDLKFVVPAMLIMGEKDYLLKFPGMEEYIRSGKMKEYVSNLEVIFMPEGSHFVQEQFPDQVNQFIMTFIKNHT